MLVAVNLAALAVFDLALPAVRIDTSAIAADLFIGVAYIVGTIIVLRGDGLDPGSLVATSAVVSGVLALSLQATLGNILGGVALQLDHSVHEGDWIQLPDGTQGKVRAIRWRHTVVETRNWDTVIVPNSNLLAANIVILGKREGQPVQHRMWVYFNVDFRYRAGARHRRGERGAARRAHRQRRHRPAAERHLLRLREGRAGQLRLLRRPLLAHGSRGRRSDELRGA